MRNGSWRKPLVGLITLVLTLSFGAGCQGMKYSDIYGGAIVGSVVGWIIGHQYEEPGNGALIGAGVGALGGLVRAIDELPPEHKEKLEKAADDVHNGSALLSHGRLSPAAFAEAGL